MTRQRRILVATAAFGGAAGVAATLVWSWLHQPSEAEQLVEILTGKNVPDAAWAFHKLEDVSDEDLRDLVQYLKDPRTTPLKAVYQKGGMQWDERRLTVLRLVKGILVSRTGVTPFADSKIQPHDRGPPPEAWDDERWALELEQFLAGRKQSAAVPSGGQTGRPKRWPGGFPVRPPAYPPSFFSAEAPAYATRIAEIATLLCGDDAALAVWLVEMLRRSPDAALDGLLAHASSAQATKVRLFYSEHDPVACAQGFTLGHVVRMMLAERLEDDVLYYNVRRYDTPCLAAEVEAAWVKHRGR